jgi:hypothetical protein
VTKAGSLAPLTWVIGRGGLLGQSLESAMGEAVDDTGSRALVWRPPEPIAWSAPGAGAHDLRHPAGAFLGAAGDRFGWL